MSVCAHAGNLRPIEHCPRLLGQLFLWLLLLVGIPPEVFAHDPVALLERMAEASHLLNYDGVFIYRRAGASDSMRIIHRSSREGDSERLLTLSGQSREVVRDEQGTRCFLPDTGEVLFLQRAPRPLMPTEITRPWSQLGEFYTFNLEGEDRVAGRPARVVSVNPRTPDRYGYRLWLDVASGLLLRSELVNGEGVVLEQVEFLTLDLPTHIPDEHLRPSRPSGAKVEAAATVAVPANTGANSSTGGDAPRPAVPQTRWQAGWLPVGFRLERVQHLSHGPDGPPFEHLAFSDGLAVLSVFVEPAAHGSAGASGFSVLGAAVAFSTGSDGHTITVVGEAPPLTVRRVAEGMTRSR